MLSIFHSRKLRRSVIILGLFSFPTLASASGGSSANYKIDNDTVSSVVTQNSSSPSYAVTSESTGNDQLTVSTTTSTTTTATTTVQAAAASSTSRVVSGSGGFRASAPAATSSPPSLGILPVISRLFTNVFGPHETPRPGASVAAVTLPSPVSSLFDIRAISVKQVYVTSEQPEVRILFDNFGEQPAKVNFTITINDQSGHEILRYDDSIMIETTGVYAKKIKRLPAGSYHVVVQTQYVKNVHDVFRFTFTVKKAPGTVTQSISEFLFSLIRSMPWQGWAWLVTAVAALSCVLLIRIKLWR